MKRIVRSNAMIKPMPKKRLMTAAMEKKNKGTNSIKASYSKKETRSVPIPSVFPCRVKNVTSLFEQRIKDEVICLPNVEFFSYCWRLE